MNQPPDEGRAWENCFYVGGADDGLIELGELTAGVALRSPAATKAKGRASSWPT